MKLNETIGKPTKIQSSHGFAYFVMSREINLGRVCPAHSIAPRPTSGRVVVYCTSSPQLQSHHFGCRHCPTRHRRFRPTTIFDNNKCTYIEKSFHARIIHKTTHIQKGLAPGHNIGRVARKGNVGQASRCPDRIDVSTCEGRVKRVTYSQFSGPDKSPSPSDGLF